MKGTKSIQKGLKVLYVKGTKSMKRNQKYPKRTKSIQKEPKAWKGTKSM